MIVEKKKCDKDFLDRLVEDTDKKFKLSDFYKRMAYLNNIKNEDIVYMFEKQMSKEVLKDCVKVLMEEQHNIDIINR